jgi:hypothetical protein
LQKKCFIIQSSFAISEILYHTNRTFPDATERKFLAQILITLGERTFYQKSFFSSKNSVWALQFCCKILALISFPFPVAMLAKHDVNKDNSILSNYELHLVTEFSRETLFRNTLL